jgi:hypothetical protein
MREEKIGVERAPNSEFGQKPTARNSLRKLWREDDTKQQATRNRAFIRSHAAIN